MYIIAFYGGFSKVLKSLFSDVQYYLIAIQNHNQIVYKKIGLYKKIGFTDAFFCQMIQI